MVCPALTCTLTLRGGHPHTDRKQSALLESRLSVSQPPSSRTKRTITMTMTTMPSNSSTFLLYRRLGRRGLTVGLLLLQIEGRNP